VAATAPAYGVVGNTFIPFQACGVAQDRHQVAQALHILPEEGREIRRVHIVEDRLPILLGMAISKGGMANTCYRSYLVRVWASTGCDGPQWAGRVECLQHDTRHGRFNDPATLLAHLGAALRDEEPAEEAEPPNGRDGCR
jgi:hypothetical protein